MSGMSACKRCRWEHIATLDFARPQPWSDDDAGTIFQTCTKCGNINIQKFSAEANGSGSIWILAPDAVVLFRQGAPPSQVFGYAFSEDFVRNRGITLSIFRGYLSHLLDLSGAANLLVRRIGEVTEGPQIEGSMQMFRDVLRDFLRRHAGGDRDARMSVSTLIPVVKVAQGSGSYVGTSAASVAELRLQALEVLEMFAQPILWNSLQPSETGQLEAAIDHMGLVDFSTAKLDAIARTDVDETVVRDAFVEAKYLHRVFRRRKARLSRAHAGAVWNVMRTLAATRAVDSPIDFGHQAYEALRALLEHQVVEMGFFKLGREDSDGTPSVWYKSPNTGEVLSLPLYEPKLTIYASPDSTGPSVTLDSWTAALDRL